jgi:hypothetical protein
MEGDIIMEYLVMDNAEESTEYYRTKEAAIAGAKLMAEDLAKENGGDEIEVDVYRKFGTVTAVMGIKVKYEDLTVEKKEPVDEKVDIARIISTCSD